MRFFEIFLICTLSIYAKHQANGAESPCGGDWEPYRDEKCFKVFGFQTFEAARKTCQQQEASSQLLTIKFREEQQFLANFLFNKSKVEDNVWVDARFQQGKLRFEQDGTEVTYTNWAQERPKNTVDHCVQLDYDAEGKWADEPCTRNGAVVCQKSQIWSVDKLQQTLLDTIKRLEETQYALERTQTQFASLQENPVPIGFIYVQLGGQPEPATLWSSTLKWEEVSANYSGQFFRVVGGNAAAFGTVQEENSPRLVAAKFFMVGDQYDGEVQIPANGEYAGRLWSGSNYASDVKNQFHAHAYKVSGGEVRPHNQATRVWKRIA